MKIPTFGSLFKRFKKLLSNPVVTNVIIVGAVTFGIKIVGFYKETLIASTFGLSLLLDTFLIAVLIPGFIQNVFIGALNSIFIPNYITEQNTTKQLGAFQSIVFCIVAGIMIFFTLLTYFSSDVFVETLFPDKSVDFYELVRNQLLIVLPALFFMGFSSVISGLLQIKDKFFATTITGVLPALSTITALLFFRDFLGDMVLAYGFLIGAILPFFFVVFLGLKYEVLHFEKPKLNTNSRIMFQQLPAKLTSGVLSGINPFVDQYFAAQLLVGSLAAINYGQKIPSFTSSILLIALSSVILPYFSKLTNSNLTKAYHQLFRMMKLLFIASFIAVVILFFLSDEIVSLLFERGKFNAENTEVVSIIMQILLVYIPFRICEVLMIRFLTSINKNAFMAYISLIRVVLNLVLNIIFLEKYGLYGLALSTTFVFILTFFMFLFYIRRSYIKVKP